MANITHTSTGASNTPRLLEVIGVLTELPMADLIMLINNDSMAGYSAGESITTLPNQHIDPNVPNATNMDATYGSQLGVDIVKLSSLTLGGKKIIKFGNHNNGVSPNYYSSKAWIRKTGLYSDTINVEGITSSALLRVDRTYWTAGLHYKIGLSASRLMMIRPMISASNNGAYRGVRCSGYTPAKSTSLTSGTALNWGYFNEDTADNLSPIDAGIFTPNLNGEWHNVIYVETFTDPKTVKVYVDGEIIISVAGIAPGAMAGISEIHFGNANTNPSSYTYGGDLAHFAVWARALSTDEIARTYNFIKDEYGLT